MAIELPGEFVWVMNLLGLNWPQVNEDKVREFAGHVRDFGTSIDTTHQAASDTIRRMGEHYQANSYELLVAKWGRMSNSHMTDLVEACRVTALALEVAADGIVAAKLAVITELGIMAAEFVADQAAAVVTFGAAEAAEVVLVEATKKVVNAILQQVEQQIIAEVIEKAVAPLEKVVENALGGLVFKGLDAALGDPEAAGGDAGDGFRIHPQALTGHAATLHGHADEVVGHANRFSAATAGMSFS
jgi:hypothetical protein